MSYKISPDGKFLAWSEDVTGLENATIYIKELKTGNILPNKISNTSGKIVWDNDSTSLYYVIKDKKQRNFQLQHKSINSLETFDVVFTETDEAFSVSMEQSLSKKMVLVQSSNFNMSESFSLTKNKAGEFGLDLLISRSLSTKHKIQHIENHFYFYTDHFSDNFDLVSAPESSISVIKSWQKIASSSDQIFFKDVTFLKNFFAIAERSQGIDKIRMVDRHSHKAHYIDFDDEVLGLALVSRQNSSSNKLRISVESNLTPPAKYDYDYIKKKLTVINPVEIEGFDESNYKQERLLVKSHDGVQVPVTLIYHKKFGPNVNNPLYLYVYGAYGIGIPPEFPRAAMSVIDRGFTYAVAHVRGGDELGKKWHEQGKLLNRKNTFSDFIAISQYLVDNQYVAKGNISASGESSGGTTLAVAINERPDLYRSVTGLVPFVDVLNTLMDTSLEYTLTDWTEFGDPYNNKTFFEYIKSYSPYDNIKPQDYPHIYVTGGLSDPAVGYWESAKWLAKIRKHQTNKKSLSLLALRDGGHIASGQDTWAYSFAKQMTFLLVAHGRK